MAEAFAKMLNVDAFSAGSNPSGKISSKAVAAMKGVGYDLLVHHSKPLEDVRPFAPFDVVVTMGCGDACPWMPAKRFVDWDIPDPKEMNEDGVRKIRDMIRDKVRGLISSL